MDNPVKAQTFNKVTDHRPAIIFSRYQATGRRWGSREGVFNWEDWHCGRRGRRPHISAAGRRSHAQAGCFYGNLRFVFPAATGEDVFERAG
jgi:hypothetical protein